MIYTSYFAMIKDLPENFVTIAICGKSPDWYTGLEYKKLAPKWNFFKIWKETHDNEYYVKEFNKQVLSGLDVYTCIDELLGLLTVEQRRLYANNELHIVLLCYEKIGDFCHRHIVSDWFNRHGIVCKEYIRFMI